MKKLYLDDDVIAVVGTILLCAALLLLLNTVDIPLKIAISPFNMVLPEDPDKALLLLPEIDILKLLNIASFITLPLIALLLYRFMSGVRLDPLRKASFYMVGLLVGVGWSKSIEMFEVLANLEGYTILEYQLVEVSKLGEMVWMLIVVMALITMLSFFSQGKSLLGSEILVGLILLAVLTATSSEILFVREVFLLVYLTLVAGQTKAMRSYLK